LLKGIEVLDMRVNDKKKSACICSGCKFNEGCDGLITLVEGQLSFLILFVATWLFILPVEETLKCFFDYAKLNVFCV